MAVPAKLDALLLALAVMQMVGSRCCYTAERQNVDGLPVQGVVKSCGEQGKAHFFYVSSIDYFISLAKIS